MTESIRVGKNGHDINAKLGDSSMGGYSRMRKPKGNVLLKLYETAREQFDSDYCKTCEALYIIYLVKT